MNKVSKSIIALVSIAVIGSEITPIAASAATNEEINKGNKVSVNSIVPHGATDIYYKLDAVLEEKEVSRVYQRLHTGTSKWVFEPAITYKGVTVKVGRYEYSDSSQWKQYGVGTYFKVRYRKETAMGNFIGYETYTTTLYNTDYVPI